MRCRILCALMFVAWTAERSQDEMYYDHWRSIFGLLDPFFWSVPGLHMMVIQLLILLAAPFCLLAPGAFRRRAWPMDAAILTSLAAIALTFVWGLSRGGSAYESYYQLRSPVVALFFALLLASVIRSPADLRAIGRTVVAAALVRATLATYFFFMYVRGRALDPYPLFITSHEDSLLFNAGILVTLAWALARRRWTNWAWFGFVFLVLAAGIKSNNRRLAWVELIAMLGFAYLVLPRRSALRRRANRLALIAAPLVLVYIAVGWGRSGFLFAPVRAISTMNADENLSTQAREEENLNLVWTYQKSPLLGQGWGHPYQEASSTFTRGFGDSFWQYPYLPHNSLVALGTFSGFVGLFGIWIVVPVAAFLATRSYWRATGRTERAAAMAALCYLPAYGEQCFGDIGFQSLTGGLLLSIAFASASRLAAWTGAWPGRGSLKLVEAATPAGRDGRAA